MKLTNQKAVNLNFQRKNKKYTSFRLDQNLSITYLN